MLTLSVVILFISVWCDGSLGNILMSFMAVRELRDSKGLGELAFLVDITKCLSEHQPKGSQPASQFPAFKCEIK